MALSKWFFVASSALLAPVLVTAQANLYAQCGGQGFTGPTSCVAGADCSSINAYYYQCVPAATAPGSAPPTSLSTVPTSRPASSGAPGSSGGNAPPSSTAATTGPAATGSGAWASAYSKAAAALAKLSNNDKVGIVTGIGWSNGPCVGNTRAASSIGYPSLCLQDGPLGVRYKQGVTAFPAGVMAASTWDPDLIYSRGNALGAEASRTASTQLIWSSVALDLDASLHSLTL